MKDAKVYNGEVVDEAQSGGLVQVAQIAGPMRQTKAGYHTAIVPQRPRNLDIVVAAVLLECEYAGDEFYYQWPVWNKKTQRHDIVEGGAIGLALSVAREWTNSVVLVDVEEGGGKWTFKVSFVDLERGFTIERIFKQTIPLSPPGKYDADRWRDLQFQVGQSKAIRNAVFAGVPRWLVKQAIEKAKEAAVKGISKEGIDTSRKKAFEFFQGYGIDEARITKVMNKSMNEFTTDDIATLRNFARQVKDGNADAENIFPPLEGRQPKVQKPKPEPKSKEKEKKEESPAPTEAPAEHKKMTGKQRGELLNLSDELDQNVVKTILDVYKRDKIEDVTQFDFAVVKAALQKALGAGDKSGDQLTL